MKASRVGELITFLGRLRATNLGVCKRHDAPLIAEVKTYPHFQSFVPPEIPPPGVGSHNTLLDIKRQKTLIYQRFNLDLRMSLDVLESYLGGRCRIRTCDFHRVKVALYR